MQAADVVYLYQMLNRAGVKIWIDGGWAVDAVVGHETRSHKDLDIAVEVEQVDSLKQTLEQHGYVEIHQDQSSQWNFVLVDSEQRSIDVHVVVLDKRDGVQALPIDGIAYPAGSLTGEGVVADTRVRCVKAEILLQFKTSYPPRGVDLKDVAELCVLLDKPIPESHKSL